MIKMALHLLKIEKRNTLNLGICIASTVTVCLIFMEILKSPFITTESLFFYNSLITFFMILMCVILMVYASNYFIRIKSREMGLLILSGLSSLKVFGYMLVQMLLVVVVFALLGFVMFMIVNPVIQASLYYILGIDANIFYVNYEALLQGLAIVIAIVFAIMLANTGFLVKTGIIELLENHNIISYKKDTRAIKPPKWLWVFIYGFGLLCMYTGNNEVGGYILFSLIGALGAYGLFRHYLPNYYHKRALKQTVDPIRFLVKEDTNLLMQQSKSFIAIVMLVMIGMVPFICGSYSDQVLHFEMHMAFTIANVLLSLTLINRFKIDHIQRDEHFFGVFKLGFCKEEINEVYKKEVISYFNHIWVLSVIYIINIFIVFYLNQGLRVMTIIIIIFEYVIPYLFAEIVILYERKKEIDHDKRYA